MNQGSVAQLKNYVLELLKYLDRKEMLTEFEKWNCPVVPITGKYLLQRNCPDGVVMGRVRQILLQKWIDSRFTLTQEELGDMLPAVLESLQDFIAEIASKKSGKRKLSSSVKN